MAIPLNLQELGEKEGFEDGWHDAMKGWPQNPRPDVGYGIFDARYLKEYSKSYIDGHKTGKEERTHRQKLKVRRVLQQEQTDDLDYEPDDV